MLRLTIALVKRLRAGDVACGTDKGEVGTWTMEVCGQWDKRRNNCGRAETLENYNVLLQN